MKTVLIIIALILLFILAGWLFKQRKCRKHRREKQTGGIKEPEIIEFIKGTFEDGYDFTQGQASIDVEDHDHHKLAGRSKE